MDDAIWKGEWDMSILVTGGTGFIGYRSAILIFFTRKAGVEYTF